MNHLQAVERETALSAAERKVVEAAKKWNSGMHSDIGTRLSLREAVEQLQRLERSAVSGSGK